METPENYASGNVRTLEALSVNNGLVIQLTKPVGHLVAEHWAGNSDVGSAFSQWWTHVSVLAAFQIAGVRNPYGPRPKELATRYRGFMAGLIHPTRSG